MLPPQEMCYKCHLVSMIRYSQTNVSGQIHLRHEQISNKNAMSTSTKHNEFDAMNALFKHARCRRALPGSIFPFFCVKVQGIKALWRLQGMGPQQHCHWNSPVTNICKNTGINHFRNVLFYMCSDVFCHVWGNSMCSAKVLFVVHVVPQPSL